MGDREHLYSCEACGKRIHEGDKAQVDNEGIALCEDHAMSLSDIIQSWEEDIARDNDENQWAEYFDSIESAEGHVARLKDQLAVKGDHKVVREV